MGNYLPQADPSNNCCDCPSRSSPCDNCCPSSVTVEFNSVIFNCGCDQIFSGHVHTAGTLNIGTKYSIDLYKSGDDFTNVGGANVTGDIFIATGPFPLRWTHGSILEEIWGTEISDVNFNGTPITLGLMAHACLDAPNFCWLHGTGLTRHFKTWTNYSCSSSPNSEGDETTQVDLYFFEGLWYLMSAPGGPILFYGTSLTPTGTYSNIAVCNFSGQNLFNPFCPPGATVSYVVFAQGGAATVS